MGNDAYLLAGGRGEYVCVYDTTRKVILSRYKIRGAGKFLNPLYENNLSSGWIRSITYTSIGYAWCAVTLKEIFIYQQKKSNSIFMRSSKHYQYTIKTSLDANFLLTPLTSITISNPSYYIEYALGKELK